MGISLEHQLEMDVVLEYPLLPVPLSLCHIDGSINKTDKSKLGGSLVNRDVEHKTVPDQFNALVIDGFFLFVHIKRSSFDIWRNKP